jgi:hypothetical protein
MPEFGADRSFPSQAIGCLNRRLETMDVRRLVDFIDRQPVAQLREIGAASCREKDLGPRVADGTKFMLPQAPPEAGPEPPEGHKKPRVSRHAAILAAPEPMKMESGAS